MVEILEYLKNWRNLSFRSFQSLKSINSLYKILRFLLLLRNHFKKMTLILKQLKLYMKKFALKSIAVVLFVSTLISSCSSDDGGESILVKRGEVTAVDGPTTAIAGETITLNVSYNIENSCGAFYRFSEVVTGQTKTIDTEVVYTGENCGSNPTTATQPYQVTVIQPGTYNFKFRKTGVQFITHTIVITE